MTVLCLDVECTTYEKGNPFVPSNSLQCISYNVSGRNDCLPILYGNEPYQHRLDTIQSLVSDSSVLVGFNIKFDLHWLKRYGINFDNKRVYDCQLAAFLLSSQRNAYPSLEACAVQYLNLHKLDVVSTEYWDNGIDTPNIPWDVLSDYAKKDVELTRLLYDRFVEIFDRPENVKLKKLLSLDCQDLLTLQEMEWNGMMYDFEKSKQKSKEISERLETIYQHLNGLISDPVVNWNSGDHLSCVLYGGTIVTPVQIANGYFVTRKRAGEPKYKWTEKETTFSRLVEPLKGSHLAKDGYWSTAEPILKQLRPKGLAKTIISGVLEASKLEKLNGTYYAGIPKLAETMGWTDGLLHGNFNQCVAVTTRLTSSRPNLQNVAGEIDELIISRYD